MSNKVYQLNKLSEINKLCEEAFKNDKYLMELGKTCILAQIRNKLVGQIENEDVYRFRKGELEKIISNQRDLIFNGPISTAESVNIARNVFCEQFDDVVFKERKLEIAKFTINMLAHVMGPQKKGERTFMNNEYEMIRTFIEGICRRYIDHKMRLK